MSSSIFLLHPCLNNYEIVAGKVIEIYLRNSEYVKSKKSTITTFFNDTPFSCINVSCQFGRFCCQC